MIKNLRQVGNSSALILDRALLELVGLRKGSLVQLTVQNGTILITPTDPERIDPARFEAALEKVSADRREALRRLSE